MAVVVISAVVVEAVVIIIVLVQQSGNSSSNSSSSKQTNLTPHIPRFDVHRRDTRQLMEAVALHMKHGFPYSVPPVQSSCHTEDQAILFQTPSLTYQCLSKPDSSDYSLHSGILAWIKHHPENKRIFETSKHNTTCHGTRL